MRKGKRETGERKPAPLACFVLTLALAGFAGAPGARGAAIPERGSAGCGAASLARGDRLERTIVIDGVARSYILDVPASVKPHAPVPLLFDFHGFGHSAAGVWNVSGFRALAPRDGFITVYPDGMPVKLTAGRRSFEGKGWQIASLDDNRDLELTKRLLDRLEQDYCIDRARVFATGFSNGAFFSNLLGCAMADRFAAIAPVSGGRLTVACAPGRGVPVLIHHGRQDDVVPVARGRQERDEWVRIDGCRQQETGTCEIHRDCRDGAVVEYCEGDFAHHWPPEATSRIWQFFRAHPMAGVPGSGQSSPPEPP